MHPYLLACPQGTWTISGVKNRVLVSWPRSYLSAKVELEVPAATATKGTPSRFAASTHATASGVLDMYLDGKTHRSLKVE